MGIWNRLNTVVRSNLGTMLDRTEDPDAVISQTVRDMEAGLKQAQRELVETLGNAKRLAQEAERERSEAARWQERATLGVRKGDDALAREALKQKLLATKKAERIAQQAAQATSAAEQMKAALEAIEAKTEELRAKKSALAAQVRAARNAGSDPRAAGGASSGGAFDELSRLTGRIDNLEAEVEAASVLEDTKKAELEARFRALEAQGENAEVEDELAALKRKVEGG